MKYAPARLDLSMKAICRVLLLTVFAAGSMLTVEAVVLPQQAQAENFFSRLFNRNNRRDELREQRIRREPPRRSASPRAERRKPTARRAPAQPTKPAIEKAEDAKKILVVGDFMAGNLADGLDERFAEKPGVRIIKRENGSSGLVREDYYDWPGNLPAIVEEEKPDVLVVMIGANDRQAMSVDGRAWPVRAPEWNDEYRQRVEQIAATAGQADIPLVWVGQPSYKFTSMNADMLAFNETYRTITEGAQGRFVDVWEGFVDQDGNFAFTGPDVRGQTVRLRNSDGINMTAAGDEKLAFYTENALDEILSGAISGKEPETELESTLPAASTASIVRTPVYRIDDPELDGTDGLLGGASQAEPEMDETTESAATAGLPPRSPAGRAADFGATSRIPDDETESDTGGTAPPAG